MFWCDIVQCCLSADWILRGSSLPPITILSSTRRTINKVYFVVFFQRVTWLCVQNSEVFKCPGLENLSRYEKLFKLPNVQNNHTCEINCWCRSLLGDWALPLNTAGQLKAIIPFTRWSIVRICTYCWERGWMCLYYDLKVLWILLQHFFGQKRCTGRITDHRAREESISALSYKIFLVLCGCLYWLTNMHERRYIFYLKCFSAKTLSSTVHTLREMPRIKPRIKDPFSL